MPSVQIAFPLTSAPGRTPQEGGGRLINGYAEKLDGNARGTVARRPVPGLIKLAETTYPHCRGMLPVDDGCYIIQDDRALYAVMGDDGILNITNLGEVTGTDNVTMARNNKRPTPDVVLVTEQSVYLLSPSSLTELSDADLPQPNSVTFLDGYFVFTIADGRFFNSGLNDTTINALDFATAEARADGLLRGIAFGQLLFLFGQQSIEVWENTSNPEGSPFSRSVVIPRGLLAKFAVAGFEDGWSNQLIWVGDDGVAYSLSGYSPTRISTSDHERMIEALADKSTLEACVYMHEGHPIWSLSSPEWTLEYDISTGWWRERKSFEMDRWRASKSAKAFGRWIVGDAISDVIYEVDARTRREFNDPLIMEVISGPGSAFPNRVAVASAQFDVIVGEGIATGVDPDQTDPKIGIAWSDDGGRTWSNPLWRSLGKQGEFNRTVSVHRTGMAGPKGRVWKVIVSDAVEVSLLGGTMNAIARAP